MPVSPFWLAVVTESELVTASRLPFGLNSTPIGKLPVANGEPVTFVSAPPEETENSDSESPFEFVTARSAPSGLNATNVGAVPVANGAKQLERLTPAETDHCHLAHRLNRTQRDRPNTSPRARTPGT